MSDDDMYWPDKYPWNRRPAPRTPARAPVMFRDMLTLLWVVFILGIVFAALAIIPNVKARDQDTLRRHIIFSTFARQIAVFAKISHWPLQKL